MSPGSLAPELDKSDAGRREAAKDLFLLTLSRTGNPSVSCQASGLTRRQVAMIRQRDLFFAQAYDEALDDAADLLEAEAWRRALEGVAQPLLRAGQPMLDAAGEVITVRRYSDPLLVMLLRGCKPGKFHRTAVDTQSAPDPAAAIKEIASDEDPPRARSTRC